MAALDIARVNLLRALRDRTNLFFVFLLPLIIIVALGAMYGGFGSTRLGIVSVGSGPLGDDLVRLLEEGELDIEIDRARLLEELRGAVEDGDRPEPAWSSLPATTRPCAAGEGARAGAGGQARGPWSRHCGRASMPRWREQSAQIRAARVAERARRLRASMPHSSAPGPPRRRCRGWRSA